MCLRILINLFRKIYSFQFKIEPNVERDLFCYFYIYPIAQMPRRVKCVINVLYYITDG